jgi:hypothetical protein
MYLEIHLHRLYTGCFFRRGDHTRSMAHFCFPAQVGHPTSHVASTQGTDKSNWCSSMWFACSPGATLTFLLFLSKGYLRRIFLCAIGR